MPKTRIPTPIENFKIGDRKCQICGHVGELIDFVPNPGAKFNRKNKCKKCDNPRQAGVQRRFRIKRREFINNLKDKPCMDCTKSFPLECMDFDHVRGIKEFSLFEAIGHNYSEEMILEEAAKCDVVCANCHRIRTHERRKNKYATNKMRK